MAKKDSDNFGFDYYSTDAYSDYKNDVLSYAKPVSKKIASLIKSRVNPSVLDVGCAKGYLLAYIKSVYGFNVRGLEFSAYAVKHADESVKKYIKKGSILSKNNFPANSFDAIFCQDVCMYLEEVIVNKAIENLVYWSGGYIFFSDVYRHSPQASQKTNPDPLRITTLSQKDYISRFKKFNAAFVTKFNGGSGGDILIFKKIK